MSANAAVGLFSTTEYTKKAASARRGGTVAPPPLPDNGWKNPNGYFPDLRDAKWICIDVETYDPDIETKGPGVRRGGFIAGIAMNSDISEPVYYPIRHEGWANMDVRKVLSYVRKQLAYPIPKIGANLLYDVDYLEHDSDINPRIIVHPPFIDIISIEGLIDENRLKRDLGTLGSDYIGEGKDESAMLNWQLAAFPNEKPKSTIWKTPAKVVGPYAQSDVTLPPLIYEKQKLIIESEKLNDVLDFEIKLLPILMKMRQRGVPVDVDRAHQVSDEMRKRERDILEEIKRQTGFTVEPWVKDSIARVFDERGIKYERTTKTGQPSITKAVLAKAAEADPIIKMIMEVRNLDKLRGTFIDGYIIGSNVNGRVHCQFHSLKRDEGGTDTGRLSSSNPNLQNIPARDPVFGPLIRSLFIPDQGLHWWSRDYDQVEYRLIVEMAHRLQLKKAAEVVQLYMNDASVDFHQILADMTGLDRKSAKNLNFGLAYGQGLDALCAALGVGKDEGSEILATYHERAPFIKKLMNHYSGMVNDLGYVTTIANRRRRFIWYETKDGGLTTKVEESNGRRAKPYAGLNSAIQGSAADVMKKAMVDAQEAGIYDVLDVPYLTVHDELDGSVDTSSPAHMEALRELDQVMKNAFVTKVPLTAGGGVGINWAAAK